MARRKTAHMGQLLHSEVWPDFFRGIELATTGTLATVCVLDAQGETRYTRSPARTLRAIHYDAERDVVELGVGGESNCGPALRYFISSPRRIIVEDASLESRVVIEDERGQLTAIALRCEEQVAQTA